MIPVPKKITLLERIFKMPDSGKILASTDTFKLAGLVKDIFFEKKLEITTYNDGTAKIQLFVDENVINNPQGYKMRITESKITIVGGSHQGLFYGIQTLKQLFREHRYQIPSMIIEDEPDFYNRGFMLDISRDRVPTMDTLKSLIDVLAELKYNQFQLYTEHTFAYTNHEIVWKDYSPLTSQDILELDNYCKERYIELVPNQNSFGHMEKWLIHDEYKHLAEAPNGFIKPWGEKSGPFSISPAVPESIEFVNSLFEELLPNFTSTKVNIGADETFDLGLGRSKELCEKFGKGRVYLNFLLDIYKIIKKHDRTMMFWGDIIKNYPELVKDLPDDVISLIWGYEANHPFEEECLLFAEKGFTFYVCPGTSSWNSFIGRSDNAIENIENAIINGKNLGASGILLTDWGDNGHPQHLPFSVIGLGYASTLGWNLSNKPLVKEFLKDLNVHIFQVKDDIAQILYTLGNLYKNAGVQIHNSSPYFLALLFPERVIGSKEMLDVNVEGVNKSIIIAKETMQELSKMRDNTDKKMLIDQIINNVEMAILGMKMLLLIKEHTNILKIPENEWKIFKEELDHVINEYQKLWLSVNRPGGLEDSTKKLTKILQLRYK
ncbi:MAG TPA: family 20 glycosylhydrolase [Defluviitoga sp.]|nr:family 20 glycosylhydrolase [Defluviitoga sp.]